MGQPSDPYNGHYPPQQVQAPPARPPRRRAPAILGLVAGMMIAVIVGGVLAVTGVLHVGSANDEPARASAAAITLPATLPGFEDYLSASAALTNNSSKSGSKTTDIMPSLRANDAKVSSLTRAAYQQANPGAAVAFEHYSDATIEHQFNVIAVRATYPGLTNGPVLDPAYLGLAVAPQRIESLGDVQCLIAGGATPAGQQPDPKQMYTTVCQRTGLALTVLVYGGNFSGTDGERSMVNVTNAAWASVTG